MRSESVVEGRASCPVAVASRSADRPEGSAVRERQSGPELKFLQDQPDAFRDQVAGNTLKSSAHLVARWLVHRACQRINEARLSSTARDRLFDHFPMPPRHHR